MLIALDWGTSNLRASLLDADGAPLETRAAASGVMAVPAGGHEAALRALCGDWMDRHRCPVVAAGMVGSRQGWREAPYLACPATPDDAARRLLRVPLGDGMEAAIVPGLTTGGRTDVMRGEETQLWGAGLDAGDCAVLPGTHSKWAWMGAGDAIVRFETHMTGELYAVLVQHSILGRLMERGGAPDPAAFDRGARLGLAEHGRLTHALFAARTAGLFDREAAAALPDFLSGILVGAEIGGALQRTRPPHVTLIGDAALVGRYAAALGLAGVDVRRAPADAATHGIRRIAVAAGLVA